MMDRSIYKRKQETCYCKAYQFPHRKNSGTCYANSYGPFCGNCGKPAETTSIDQGYGVTEFWGSVSNHKDVCTVSDCCEADLYADASLTKFYD